MSKHVFKFMSPHGGDTLVIGQCLRGATRHYLYRICTKLNNRGTVEQLKISDIPGYLEQHNINYADLPSILDADIVLLDYTDETLIAMGLGQFIQGWNQKSRASVQR